MAGRGDGKNLDALGRSRVQTVRPKDEVCKVVQSDQELTDIRRIISRYKTTGVVESLNTAEAAFADVSEHTDYADVMRTARAAENMFMRLAPEDRALFDNDVSKWLDAAHDDDKRAAMVEAGELPPKALEDVSEPPEEASGGV